LVRRRQLTYTVFHRGSVKRSPPGLVAEIRGKINNGENQGEAMDSEGKKKLKGSAGGSNGLLSGFYLVRFSAAES
jgi:hypothetical protein